MADAAPGNGTLTLEYLDKRITRTQAGITKISEGIRGDFLNNLIKVNRRISVLLDATKTTAKAVQDMAATLEQIADDVADLKKKRTTTKRAKSARRK